MASTDTAASTATAPSQPPRRRRFPLPAVAVPRPLWWTQVLLAVGFAWGYDALRETHGDVHAAAVAHGRDVLRLDRDLHSRWVHTLTAWVNHHDAVADFLAGYYVVMHLGVVSATLVVLWLEGRQYRWHRDTLLLISAISFVVFWFYPVAPPRLVGAGFGDTVRHVLPFAYRTEAAAANLYAAVPSLHIAWALWAAIALCSITRRLWVRILAIGHVLVTTVTVLGTGNHYLVDVLAGVAVTAIGYLLMPASVAVARRLAPRLVMVRRPRRPAQAPAPS